MNICLQLLAPSFFFFCGSEFLYYDYSCLHSISKTCLHSSHWIDNLELNQHSQNRTNYHRKGKVHCGQWGVQRGFESCFIKVGISATSQSFQQLFYWDFAHARTHTHTNARTHTLCVFHGIWHTQGFKNPIAWIWICWKNILKTR